MTFYLCDGNDEECKKSHCYLNGGDCRYTSKIKNAKNFKIGINELDFFEQGDDPNIKNSLKDNSRENPSL